MPNLLPLLQWFKKHQRKLPWREDRTPYSVWISEMMLQQTQVSVVLPYFERWMKTFPTIEALAEAPLELVIKQWEGLGYYARAKNLHRGAQYIVNHHQGIFPDEPSLIAEIPGIGPYTLGAILAFAFQKKALALDGNVIRVLSRLFAITEDVTKPATLNLLRQEGHSLLPEAEPWTMTEALIELGALICKKNPSCHLCPLKNDCQALARDQVTTIPVKKPRTKTVKLYRVAPLIHYENNFLVRKVPDGEIMAGLYEFPWINLETPNYCGEKIKDDVLIKWGYTTTNMKELSTIKHTFTHFSVTIIPTLLVTSCKHTPAGYQWLSLEALKTFPFSSGHRKILTQLIK